MAVGFFYHVVRLAGVFAFLVFYLRLEVSMCDEVKVEVLQPGQYVRKVAGRQWGVQATAYNGAIAIKISNC